MRGLLVLIVVVSVAGCIPQAAPERLPVVRDVNSAAGAVEPCFLDLGNQSLPRFPEGGERCPGVVKLSVRGNALGAVDGAIGQWVSLLWLDCAEAGVKSLPPEVSALQKLETLYLADNQLSELPPELGSLAVLKYLNLDRNALVTLPESIGNLQALKWLRLNRNRLTTLPAAITGLTQLERLYLRENELTSLPVNMGEMKSLKWLFLSGNPLPEAEKNRLREALPECEIEF